MNRGALSDGNVFFLLFIAFKFQSNFLNFRLYFKCLLVVSQWVMDGEYQKLQKKYFKISNGKLMKLYLN